MPQPLPNLAAPVAGNPISQAYLTAQMYNPLTFLLNPPVAFLYASAVQSLATSGTNYLININTAVTDPYAGYASNAWVVPVSGWYNLDGVVNFAGNSSGNRACWFTTDKVNLTTVTGTERFTPPGSSTMSAACGGMAQLNQGATLSLVGYQSSGGSLSTVAVGGTCATMKVTFAHA